MESQKKSQKSKCAKTKICLRAGMVSVGPCAPRVPPADGASPPAGPRFALRVARFGANPSPGADSSVLTRFRPGVDTWAQPADHHALNEGASCGTRRSFTSIPLRKQILVYTQFDFPDFFLVSEFYPINFENFPN